MNNLDLQSDGAYAIWNERSVIADCLADLGMKDLSKKATDLNTSRELIDKFLNIIEREAQKLKRHDVLDRLYFAGLIYG